MGDPACIRAEPKEALQGTSLCELSPRHQKGNGRAARRRQERSARRAGGRERSTGGPRPGKKQGEEGRAWEEHGGAQRGGESDGGKRRVGEQRGAQRVEVHGWRTWNPVYKAETSDQCYKDVDCMRAGDHDIDRLSDWTRLCLLPGGGPRPSWHAPLSAAGWIDKDARAAVANAPLW